MAGVSRDPSAANCPKANGESGGTRTRDHRIKSAITVAFQSFAVSPFTHLGSIQCMDRHGFFIYGDRRGARLLTPQLTLNPSTKTTAGQFGVSRTELALEHASTGGSDVHVSFCDNDL